MIKRLWVLLAFATVAAVALSVSARAQQAPEAASGPASRHHEALYEVMQDMTREMRRMTEQMAQGEVPAEQRNGMAQRMERMSSTMQRMSGLLARPAMNEPGFRAQMEQMRKQMNEMAGGHAAAPKAQAADAAAEADRRMAEIEAALDESEAQMERIHGTSDTAEREKVLRGHGQAMRENVRAMRAIDEPFSRAMRSMMASGKRAPSSESMMKAHALIARRIALMDRMMGQMMEQSMGHQESSGEP